MFFAFRVPDAGSAILACDDLKALDDTGSAKLLPDDLQQGWYIMLRPGEQNAGEEYVTAKPVLAGVMFSWHGESSGKR